MSNVPYVTIGVPVYKGELFIEETLRSIQNQTYRNIEVIISLDGPQPTVEQLCQPFLKDSRFRIVVQPERLGWVGNINWLMAQVETPYWYYNAQDDLVSPRYVETLVKHAEQIPEAAIVHCDIAAFGLQSFKLIQPSVTGNALTRQLALLHMHLQAAAYHGLTRLEALQNSNSVRINEIETFATDVTWVAAMARWGELHRVPVELYQKRYHSKNVHMKWFAWPAEKLIKAYMIHCADMFEQAMLVDTTTQERRLLWLAGVERLLSSRVGFLPSANFTLAGRVSLLNAFFEHLQTTRHIDIPLLLEESWSNIKQWTQKAYCSSTNIEIRLRIWNNMLKNFLSKMKHKYWF